jgi:glycerol-1-phosphatase
MKQASVSIEDADENLWPQGDEPKALGGSWDGWPALGFPATLMEEDAPARSTASISTLGAFHRYEAIRSRLPTACFPARAGRLPTLSEAAEQWDGFVLDAFGVLNIGDTPIPGAVARMLELRTRGKRLCVLTNAGSYPRVAALEKYHRLGFDFTPDELVSSRDVAATRLESIASGATWGVIAADGDDFGDLPVRVEDLMAMPGALEGADAILFLSSARWNTAWQDRLLASMERRPRPLVVANPDLVAPREGGLTYEPGYYAHDLMDRLGLEARFFGKPFAEGFHDAASSMDVEVDRLAMVGDTLHTDVLGGAAHGLGTVLVTQHGLFAGYDVDPFITRSGIVPDLIVGTT